MRARWIAWTTCMEKSRKFIKTKLLNWDENESPQRVSFEKIRENLKRHDPPVTKNAIFALFNSKMMQRWTLFYYRNPLTMNPLFMKIFFCLPDKMTKFFKNMGPYWYLYIMLYDNIILIFRQYDFPIVNMNVTRTVLDLGLERNQHVRVSILVFSRFFDCETNTVKKA